MRVALCCLLRLCMRRSTGVRVGVAGSKRRQVTASKRELIDTGTDKRYVRRNKQGPFKDSDDIGRSRSQDVRTSKRRVRTSFLSSAFSCSLLRPSLSLCWARAFFSAPLAKHELQGLVSAS